MDGRQHEMETLRNEFGKDIVFWGGGIDTQRQLPYTEHPKRCAPKC